MADNDPPLRIAMLDANLHAFYGAQRRMLILAKGLAARHDVRVVTTGPGMLAERAGEARLPVSIIETPPSINRFGGAVLTSRGWNRIGTAKDVLMWSLRFGRWLRANDIDVVVANDLRSCLMAGPGTRMVGRPLVWSVRDDVRNGRLHTIATHLATRVVTVSNGVQGVFTAAERRSLGDRCITVYNGLPVPDPPADARASLRSELGMPADGAASVIVLVGMLTPRKGHADAVRALANLRHERGLDVVLAAIGDAPAGYESYRDDVTALARSLGVDAAVYWLGFRTDAVDLVAGADLLLLPSTHEGLPGVLIEALGVGVPAVTYASAGADEVVLDGSTGSVVPIGDVAGLAAKSAHWLADPRSRGEAGAAGRRDMAARFSIDSYVAGYERVLKGAVKPARRASVG